MACVEQYKYHKYAYFYNYLLIYLLNIFAAHRF